MAIEMQTNMILEAEPTQSRHVVHIEWVEGFFASKIKRPVRVVSMDNLDADYDVTEKTLTLSEDGVLEVDGVELREGDRVLVVGQSDSTQNGIYVVVEPGDASNPAVLQRADDFDIDDIIESGLRIDIEEGEVNNDTTWKLITPDGSDIIVGTTTLNFSRVTNIQPEIKVADTIEGNGTTTTFTIVHNLGTTDVKITVLNIATGATVWTDTSIVDENSITVSFAVAPPVGRNYRVIVIG